MARRCARLQIGRTVKRDMPQLTGPEVARLYDRGERWLLGEPLGT